MGYIKLGSYNKYYKYILFQVICNLLYHTSFGLSHGSVYEPISFFGIQGDFSSHHLINNIFYYVGTFFFSLIIYKFNPYTKKNNKSNNDINSSIKLIKYKNKNIKKEYYIIILISFLWVIHEQLIISYYYFFDFAYLDYWTLEILITYYISKKMFNIEIYKHQKFAIFFNSVLCSLFLLLSFIMSLINKKESILKGQPVLIPIGITFFLIIIFIRSYTNCKIKWISDLKDISISKILMFYGIFGAIICSLVSLITTYSECNYDKYIKCPVKDDKNKVYFENYFVYHKHFSSSKIIFLSLTFFSMIFGFLKSLFYIIIIKYLTPIHAIALPTIYHFLLIIILGIYSLIKQMEYNDLNEIEVLSNICDTIAFFFAILGIFIYSELIELNFCKLNYNLRYNIIKRGEIDIYLVHDFKEGKDGQILPDDDDDIDGEDEDEENERKNELSKINYSKK